MTFRVTILILVYLQIRKCTEYVVAIVFILNPQVDGLEVQRLLALNKPLTVVGELPINGDVRFLLFFFERSRLDRVLMNVSSGQRPDSSIAPIYIILVSVDRYPLRRGDLQTRSHSVRQASDRS